MSATDNLARLGLTLPPPAEAMGNYMPWRLAGTMLFLSGVGVCRGIYDGMPYRGRRAVLSLRQGPAPDGDAKLVTVANKATVTEMTTFPHYSGPRAIRL